jgi:hypothetical protein
LAGSGAPSEWLPVDDVHDLVNLSIKSGTVISPHKWIPELIERAKEERWSNIAP